MKHTLLIFSVLAVILIGSGYFIIQNKSTPSLSDSHTPTNITTNGTSNNSANKVTEGYLSYSTSILTQTKDRKRILYFYANWCPICRPADVEFKANQDKIPSDTVVIRVNYNDSDTDGEEKQLAQQYGVSYQHTYVQIDENGDEVTRWNGGALKELLTNTR